jgi:hypothetical protein
MPELEFVSRSSPAEVLARLGARGREWRSSVRPSALAQTSASGVRVRIHGEAFRLTVAGWLDTPRLPIVCAGEVKASDGGAVVRAAFRQAWPARLANGAVLLVLGFVGTGAGWLWAAVVAGIAAAGFALTRAAHARTTEIQRAALEEVLRDAVSPTPRAPDT